MREGMPWYPRKPAKFLGGVQGLTARQIAVYNIVTDLLYLYGGAVNDDPKWFAGYISDMGSAAVRTTVAELIERGKLYRDHNGDLRNKTVDEAVGKQVKRRKNPGKTCEKPEETAEETAEKPAENSADLDIGANDNSNLPPPHARGRQEKSREDNSEDKSSDDGLTRPAINRAVEFLVGFGHAEKDARAIVGRWRKTSTDQRIHAAISSASNAGVVDPVAWISARLEKPVTAPPKARQPETRLKRLAFLADWVRKGTCPPNLIKNSDSGEMIHLGLITADELKSIGVYP